MLKKGSLGRALAIYYGVVVIFTAIVSILAHTATPIVGCVIGGAIAIPCLVFAYFYEHKHDL